MSDHREQVRKYHAAIRDVLMREWDPIGMADIPEASDEYDSWISQIYALLVRREPPYKVLDFLWWIETEHLGLAGNRRRTERVADHLMRLPAELGQDAEPTDAEDSR